MAAFQSSADSDSDDLIEGSWSLRKRKKLAGKSESENCTIFLRKSIDDKVIAQSEKFNKLKTKSSEIFMRSSIRQQKTELRRSQKVIKRALTDPWIKAAVEEKSLKNQEEGNKNIKQWEDVKPYLSINDHLAGPVSHGDCGPKTEMELLIEDCIKDGDFEKAELLSDTLANREFAVKIAHAFEAKKCHERIKEEKDEEKKKQLKKIRWTFDAKEKWQMKGNM